MIENIFSIAQYADIVVIFILLTLSIISLGIIIERFQYLGTIYKNSQTILDQLDGALKINNLKEIKKISKSDEKLFADIAQVSILHIEKHGEIGLDEIFNTYMISIKPKLDRFLSFLGTIGSNAPYIGLLGTVLGIMKSFHDMAHSSSEAGQMVVMAGISSALIATAAGLLVAIPSVAFYNHYSKKVQSILNAINGIREISLAFAKNGGKNEIK